MLSLSEFVPLPTRLVEGIPGRKFCPDGNLDYVYGTLNVSDEMAEIRHFKWRLKSHLNGPNYDDTKRRGFTFSPNIQIFGINRERWA